MKELFEFYLSLAVIILIGYAGINSLVYLICSYIEWRNKR
ncbi:hypothetical protein NIGALANA_11 [Bacillus phage Nigalana]|uniref:Uncharacterized protein n=2 Tax=Wphvirus megatron TaxID=1987728 RepID=A0A143FP09_9CAUD|nr:hypothetical protein QLX47_gp013 [Bacillus phage Eyuki]YP_009280385.1 hypothetical protein BI039_gp011 [Bacillus phage Belinda]YP_009280815.1 hypothetical protein SAGEFAYGE_12 [Bacillus phage SageFayge]YP_009282403.1 hypothetical protein BI005_gp011 [Bacillus phage Nigalana]AXQ67631.1 hypothetical protein OMNIODEOPRIMUS_11 [Bacillus phage OmnioDeoPrimus]ALA46571.1 hypothetical protein EYUKI_13 [Bacillus phage Eyuki]AMW61166.1 hypothetical protein NIGALANA_11 [Bacillus phage Nigalana]AMW62